ncbi:MAG: phosphate/phosphite/phosphonate ABC transporter substrate-binding protein [Alphaproteobacteria bacterium]|uniref:Phosphate/phosphite/phosphonate ABC transporter substrate-binding protein n=1 Tax=Candidatus Nitrobium versatile TaxID=2884831 RepID=A0A953J854_9BACT|nr:phosphate/phosphite/phosphonate ABC transporter substrate-binding protein [Candidatus Nitrobium versatile]
MLTRLLFVVLLLLVSCGGTPAGLEKKGTEPKKIREGTFTIALLPEQNVFEQKKKYKPLIEYLSRVLDTNVKIKLLDSYGSIYDEITSRRIDGAFFGSFNYILTKAKADIEPIARPVERDGSSSYRGIIFTRKDSPVSKDVHSWKGKRIALVHEVTTAGYVFPRWYLKQRGIDGFEGHFGRILFTGSHDAAILSVYKGQADLGAAKDLVFERLLAANPAIKGDLTVIAESIEVPSNSLCVRGDIPPAFRSKLKAILLSLHMTSEGQKVLQSLEAVRFRETTDSEFAPLREMVREMGIDSRTYHFRDRK